MMLLLHLYGADRAGIQVSRKHAKRDYGGGGGGGDMEAISTNIYIRVPTREWNRRGMGVCDGDRV